MNKTDRTLLYHPPQLYVTTYSVEGGFMLSNTDVSAPDFEEENEI